MKYVNCPVCGGKLLEGEEGSRVVVKCAKCGRLAEAVIGGESVTVPSEPRARIRTQNPRGKFSRKIFVETLDNIERMCYIMSTKE